MAQIYWGKYRWDIERVFGSDVLPCGCGLDNHHGYFNVATSTGTTYEGGYGPIVKSVRVSCTDCGRTRVTDVSDRNIYEGAYSL